MAVETDVICPRCRKTEASPLARDGDLQRYQCLGCSENFSVPAPLESAVAAPAETSSPGHSYAPVNVPEPTGAVNGRPCPKCGKLYLRLGSRYDRHVQDCNGIASSTSPQPRSRTQAPDRVVPVAPGTMQAFGLSIDALKAQRQALEAEIRGIDMAIATLERIKGAGGAPPVPFVSGE